MEKIDKNMDYLSKLHLTNTQNKMESPLQRKRKKERGQGIATSLQLREIRRNAIRYINPDVEP